MCLRTNLRTIAMLRNLIKKKPFLSISIRSIHKYIYGMNKAYLRRNSEGDKFDITFQFTEPAHKIDRNFNFSRNLNENVAAFLRRVTTNVEKVIAKANKKKGSEGKDGLTSADVSLLVNKERIKDETLCRNVFVENNNVTLKVFNREYEVIINAPFVENLMLPSAMLAQFPIYPLKFESVFVDIEKSQFSWYKSVDKVSWSFIGDGYVFTPNNDTVNCYLKLICVPKNHIHEGPQIETISDNVVGSSPGRCPFEARHEFTKTRTGPDSLRVVTYNLLADLYCDSDYTRQVLHPYCPPYALAIDYRKQLFLKEIMGYNSDLVCLQEVDRKIYQNDLNPVLTKLKYNSHFTLKGGEVAEGTAIFYYKDKFRLISKNDIVLSDQLPSNYIFKDIWEAISTIAPLKERFLERKTTVQVLTLECSENKNLVLIANTHLYFHPDADHIRLIQGAMAMKYVAQIYNEMKQSFKDRKLSVVFCGDFNSTPDCGIYKLFTTGSVASDFKDWSSNVEQTVKNLFLTQTFKMASACGTPKYTNYTVGFADCLDYIFYDTDALEVAQAVPMPTNDELILHTALPSVVFPSDHISLCADLKWK